MLCEGRDLDRTAHIESTLVDPSVAGEGLPCRRPVPVVWRSWIFRLSDTNSGVPAVAQVDQQRKRRRGLTGFMTVVCLEPEAVDNGPVDGGALVVHRAMRGAVVGSEGRDVEVLVCDGTG